LILEALELALFTAEAAEEEAAEEEAAEAAELNLPTKSSNGSTIFFSALEHQ